jgi:hypothetical protein
MLPPKRPPLPRKYSFGNRARACFDPVGFSRMCVRPLTQALGERRAPQHWCNVGAGMWGDMEGTGEHKRDSEFPPRGCHGNKHRTAEACNKLSPSVHGEVSGRWQGGSVQRAHAACRPCVPFWPSRSWGGG